MKRLKDISRYMALLLRHSPEKEKLRLDKEGYCSVDILCERLGITKQDLDWIVDNNDKKRFAYNSSKTLIRASQGHSIDHEISYTICSDVPDLYHGAPNKVVDLILIGGIRKMDRTHVHLSDKIETATKVGARRGEHTILKIDGNKMIEQGGVIYISDNGVYLTDFVDPKYISIHDGV